MRPAVGAHGKLKLLFLLTAAVCCLLFMCLIAQLWGYNRLTRELTAARGELAHVEGGIAAQENEQEKLLEINSKIADLEKLFEIEIRDGAPLILLGELSKAVGVEVTGLTPEEVKENSSIIEVPLLLSVKGDYLDILAFCQELDDNALQNLTVVRHIKITAGRKSSKQEHAFDVTAPADAPHMVNAELELSIYTSKNPQKYSFDWERGNHPSIFHRPAAIDEPPSQPTEGTQL